MIVYILLGFFWQQNWKHENTVPICENIIPWTPFMTLKLVINYVKGNSVYNLNSFLIWIVIYWKILKIKVLHVSVEIVLLLLINRGLHSYWTCLQRIFQIMSWSWLYGSWIYNYLCNQCLSSLKLWVQIPLVVRCSWYNIMW